MVRINLYITIPQLSTLEAIRQETGASVAETIRRALDAYLTAPQPVASPRPASAKRRVRKAK